MDAGVVLTPAPPQAAPSAPDAPADQRGDDAAAFAAHLASEESAARPTPRRAPRPSEDDAAAEGEAIAPAPQPPAQPPQTQPIYSLSSPSAPAIVRTDARPGEINVAFTPAPTATSPAAQTQTTPLPVATPQVAPADVAPGAPLPAAPGSPQNAPALPDSLLAATPTPAGEITAPIPAAPKPATSEPLRASARGREGRDEIVGADAPKGAPTAQPALAVAAASARGGHGGDSSAPGQNQQGAAKADAPAPTPVASEALPAHTELRRAAEAPSQVHRPPTVAATVAQHVIRRFDGNSTTIDVRLDPAELGRVHVKLDVGADSRVTAVVAADNPATLSDLMRSARDLERALESAGLELTSGGLSFDLSDRQSGFETRGEDAASANGALRGPSSADADMAPAPASRPFGLETWRGVRVDMTV